MFLKYDDLSVINIDPSNPHTTFRKVAQLLSPRSLRKIVFEWGDVYKIVTGAGPAGGPHIHTGKLHVPMPQEVNIIAILIGLLLPYFGPFTQISVAGFDINNADLAMLSRTAGRQVSKSESITIGAARTETV